MLSQKLAKTEIEGQAIISTVMLPFPIGNDMYETMIFSDDNKYEDYQVRSETEIEALLGHIDAIALVIKGE